jgi:hypothetical protein
MRHFALTALLSVAGLAACGKDPLGPSASTATPLAKSIAAAPISSAPRATAPSATAPSAAAPSAAVPTNHTAAAAAQPPAAASATDGSDCVQTAESEGECGSQVGDVGGPPDTGTPETPESGTPETPGTETPKL